MTPHSRARATGRTLATAFAWLLITFLVLFPKGGFKVGGVPVTWGFILLGLCGPPLVIARLVVFPLRAPIRLFAALACAIPFQVIFLYTAVFNGISDIGSLLACVTNFYYIPWLFLLVFPCFYPRLDGPGLARHFRFCILAAALFGIAMFFYHPIVGSFIEIPFLTVNSGDYGELELRKHIVRGAFLKLISTYNNGNLYGVATLILLPLYNMLEPKRWKRYTLLAALIFTLSRTVWAGLILQEVFSLAIALKTSFRRFPRVVPGPAVRGALTVAAMVLLVLFGLLFNANKLSFLFDENLGGRAPVLAAFSHPHWLPAGLAGQFSEIVYASVLSDYGIVGLLAFILLFASPIVLYLLQPHSFRSPLQRAALRGLVLYAVVAASDGAINLIPVLAFYWFAYMIFLFGWPGARPATVSQPIPPSVPDSSPTRAIPATAGVSTRMDGWV